MFGDGKGHSVNIKCCCKLYFFQDRLAYLRPSALTLRSWDDRSMEGGIKGGVHVYSINIIIP